MNKTLELDRVTAGVLFEQALRHENELIREIDTLQLAKHEAALRIQANNIARMVRVRTELGRMLSKWPIEEEIA